VSDFTAPSFVGHCEHLLEMFVGEEEF